MSEFERKGTRPIDYHQEIDRVDGEIAKFRSVSDFLNFAIKRDQESVMVFRLAEGIADAIVPIDRSTGQRLCDDAQAGNIAKAYCGGVVIGWALVGEKLQETGGYRHSLISKFPEIAGIDDGADEFESMHQVADSIMNLGGRGISLLGEKLPDEVENWEEALVPTVSHQVYFRRGLGLVLYRADAHFREADRAEMEALVNNADKADWNEALKYLTGKY